MKAKWIIENFAKEPSYTELANTVQELGYPLIKINGDYSKSMFSALQEGKHCVIFNGSIEMTKLVYSELSHTCFPVRYCNFENYFTTNYYSKFQGLLFNDNVLWTTVSQFIHKKFLYYSIFGKDALIFIRPDSGEKTFQAQLLDIQDVDRVFKGYEESNDLVMLSTPKNINGEWRFIVSRDNGIISYSTYRFQGQTTKIPGAPIGAIEKCREVLSRKYFPDSVFVIDICEDNDGNYWLLELNSFSSAGLYASDKRKIVNEVSKIAEKEAALAFNL